MSRLTLDLKGGETVDVVGIETITPRMQVEVRIHRENGTTESFRALCRIDTDDEVEYYRHGGILQYVLRGMAKAA